MARPLRLHIPGMPYHVMSRGNNKQQIFVDARDHLRYLELLTAGMERFAISCLAYCMMHNHLHLLLVPGEHTISRLMQQVNSDYCRGFNRRHRRVGHVLQGRPAMKIVDTDAYLLTAVRYVLRNPVVSGLAATPSDWRWSSYGALMGRDPCPTSLSFERIWRALDAPSEAVGRERLQGFLECEEIGEGLADLENSLLLGGENLGRLVDPLLPPHRQVADFTYEERFATRPSLEGLFAYADTQSEVEEVAREAFSRHAYTLVAIAAVLGRPSGTVWSWIRRAARRASPAENPRGPRSPRRPGFRGQISIFE